MSKNRGSYSNKETAETTCRMSKNRGSHSDKETAKTTCRVSKNRGSYSDKEAANAACRMSKGVMHHRHSLILAVHIHNAYAVRSKNTLPISKTLAARIRNARSFPSGKTCGKITKRKWGENMKNMELLTHSSIRLQTDDGRVIYVDPFQIRDETHDADIILSTHDHYDHFSPEDIAKITKKDTVLIVPEKMTEMAKAAKAPEGKIYGVAQTGEYEIEGIQVETLPAYNKEKQFHPKDAQWVGYILTVDGKRIYVAGDTDMTEESQNVRCDVAFIPVGGTFTMDFADAAKLANAIHPEVVIPTHYGQVAGSNDDAEKFRAAIDPAMKVEIIKQY